ncbi:hypothetical protein [Mycobacterium sp. RTGN5]|uniref:hypothetical protein n=1 Tax=Mycobacterium sp. RTGN5 TaxID=3016522 RepID=UPI0029C6D332|nr:hypothetical protein [Mycobacterium sp. RTGN5]
MRYFYRTLVTSAAAAALVVGAAVTAMATAAADDLPPADPGAPAPPPQQGFVPSGVALQDSLNGFAGILGGPAGNQMLLGQTPAPAVAPGGNAPATPPDVQVLDGTQLLLPRNYRTQQGADDPTPSPYDLQQGVPPGPFARVDGLKGVHAMVHGALGRMPADQLGQPLPGTAPPPGTNIPAGPEDFLPDPAALPPPGAPAVPGVPAPPADPAQPLPPPPPVG